MPRKPNPMKRVIENLPFEPVTVSIKEWEGNIWVHSFQGTWGKNTKRISIPAEYFCETTKADELVELICGSSDASVIIKPKSSLGKLPISFSSKSDGNETVFALSLGGVPSSGFSSPLAEIIFSLEGAKEFVETFEWVQTAIRREFEDQIKKTAARAATSKPNGSPKDRFGELAKPKVLRPETVGPEYSPDNEFGV